jgi:hydroxylamine reductase
MRTGCKGSGCTKIGVCGKNEEVAALQDLLIHSLKGLSLYANEGRNVGIKDDAVNTFTCEAIFSTLTNVNFDAARFVQLIQQSESYKAELKKRVKAAGGKTNFSGEPAPSFFEKILSSLFGSGEPAGDFVSNPGMAFDLSSRSVMVDNAASVGITADASMDADIRSLQQILVLGVKGTAAYADHARILGQTDEKIYAFIHEALAATLDKSLGINDLVGLALKCGEMNLRAMELLDAGNTGTFGHPVPTPVPLGAKAGKAILVSGHDLADLSALLKQTEGTGINIYTHGEMLPCHAYPELKKYEHFYGHYGTAWQNQQKEFAAFPGAILG